MLRDSPSRELNPPVSLGTPDQTPNRLYVQGGSARPTRARGKATMTFRGFVIAEAFKDPTVVNKLSVYRARITDEGVPIYYEGHTGR
jgi:hypothetical protein